MHRYAPPWRFALGLALGFYPVFLPAAALVGVASLVGAASLAALPRASGGGPRSQARRRRAILGLVASFGIVVGLALRLDETGRPGLWEGPRPDAPVPHLALRGLAGRLESDSRATASGARLYPLALAGVSATGPGVAVSGTAAGSLALLVRGGPVLVAGDQVEASGVRLLGPGLAVGDTLSLRTARGEGVLRDLRRHLKEGWHRALEAAGGGGASSGLLVALLEGRRDGLDLEEARAFTEAGCVAVLSLSGQHLSILAAALAFLLKPLGGPRKARALSVGAAALFVFVAGPEPALLRSLLMFGLGAAALFLDAPAEGRTILGLSFALQLLLDPASGRNLSFCLSYLALVGLVVATPRFTFLFLPVLPPAVAGALGASCGAFLATLPLAAASFGVVYPVGLLATVVTAPLVAAYLWWGLGAAVLCCLAPGLGGLVAAPTGLLHGILVATMEAFSRAPSLPLPGTTAPLLASAAIVLILGFVYAWPHAQHALHPSRPSPRGTTRL